MYIKGRKVHKHKFVLDSFYKPIVSYTDCRICGGSPVFLVEVCFNKDDFWDDVTEVDLCEDCLISDFYFSREELYEALGE